jgi:hypothetical protein
MRSMAEGARAGARPAFAPATAFGGPPPPLTRGRGWLPLPSSRWD